MVSGEADQSELIKNPRKALHSALSVGHRAKKPTILGPHVFAEILTYSITKIENVKKKRNLPPPATKVKLFSSWNFPVGFCLHCTTFLCPSLL